MRVSKRVGGVVVSSNLARFGRGLALVFVFLVFLWAISLAILIVTGGVQ